MSDLNEAFNSMAKLRNEVIDELWLAANHSDIGHRVAKFALSPANLTTELGAAITEALGGYMDPLTDFMGKIKEQWVADNKRAIDAAMADKIKAAQDDAE